MDNIRHFISSIPNFVKILDKYWKGNTQTNKQIATRSVHLRTSRKGMIIKTERQPRVRTPFWNKRPHRYRYVSEKNRGWVRGAAVA